MDAGDLGAVSIFVKVVELKSFRAAARALGTPKSTVSLRVAQLEDRLGVRLLDRTTRSLRLTEDGRTYYLQACPALAALADAERAVRDAQTKMTGRLRMTAPVELGQNLLAAPVSEYMRRHPGVEIELTLTDRRVNLVDEGFDLAVRRGLLSNSALIARKLGAPDDLRHYASPKYLRRRGEPRHPRELMHHDCLVMGGRAEPTTWKFRDREESMRVAVRPRITVNSFSLLRDLVRDGHGITALPQFIAAPARHAGDLVPVLDAFRPAPMALYAMYASTRNASPKMLALLALLSAHFATYAGYPEPPMDLR